MKKVRIDVPNLIYSIGITMTILTASHILPIEWSGLFDYWILALTYGAAELLTQGIISGVHRSDDK